KVRERFLAEIDDPTVREAKRRAAVDLFRIADRDACRHRGLLAYFGEDFEACGESCDVCTGLGVTDLVDVLPVLKRKPRAGRAGGHVAGGRATAADADRSPSDPTFQRLRTLRKQLADARGVPAYIVFSDQVLWDLIDLRPGSPEEMLRVPGIGPAKLEQYGDVFLDALREG
ncbi:MAG: ATP-dependent DNA helicase RecQ, partial [Gemmatimonadales bacterium]|nr:ATP-dependent DNA helicase RecQ [Candidatus Palauibacter denitrificans]